MSIQRYIEQLIEEIDEKMKIPYPVSIRNAKKDNYLYEADESDELMEYHSIPLTNFSNISKESLPPPEKLNEEQSTMLVDKISVLLDNWNFHLEYPEITPVKEKYRLIYDHWEEFQVPTSGWHYHQDFCTGDCEDCEVKYYCKAYDEEESFKEFNLSDESEMLHPGAFAEEGSDSNSGKEITVKEEKVKKILKSIKEKDFIPSIHNYCDRWCDKCSLQSRCSAFFLEKELLKPGANDNSEKSSIESVKHALNLTHDILEVTLKEKNIDFELPVTTNDSFFPELPVSEKKVLDYAKEYAFRASEWLKALPEEKITAIHELIVPVNVISYYHIFIPSKMARAFFGRVSQAEDEPIQNDSNGSAKVALMAIAKSVECWTHLLNYLKQDEEVILQHCVQLGKLKKMVESSFPHAQKFVRPGFDSQAK